MSKTQAPQPPLLISRVKAASRFGTCLERVSCKGGRQKDGFNGRFLHQEDVEAFLVSTGAGGAEAGSAGYAGPAEVETLSLSG